MIKIIDEIPIADRRVFIRVDFNVPIKEENGVRKVGDDTRIREALPTIRYAMEKGAKVILASHLGRPKGSDPKYSLEPIAEHLSNLLETEVLLTDDCVGDGIEMIVRHLKSTQITLLENLRFHGEEEANDAQFARSLSALADVYVTDAFGTTHRQHASTYGVPLLMPLKGAGFLIKKELQFLNRLLEAPEHPYVVILGGSKVSDKIKTIENLFLHADTLLIGGAMAHAFRLAKGDYDLPSGAKAPSKDDVDHARSLMTKAAKHEVSLLIPIDDVQGFDIGPKTIELFRQALKGAKTVFWNGPLGMFEKPEYAKGTIEIAKAVSELENAMKVVGGGDTVSAVNLAGVSDHMSHISTGGGATLEFLEGKGLPGINVLHSYQKS